MEPNRFCVIRPPPRGCTGRGAAGRGDRPLVFKHADLSGFQPAGWRPLPFPYDLHAQAAFQTAVQDAPVLLLGGVPAVGGVKKGYALGAEKLGGVFRQLQRVAVQGALPLLLMGGDKQAQGHHRGERKKEDDQGQFHQEHGGTAFFHRPHPCSHPFFMISAAHVRLSYSPSAAFRPGGAGCAGYGRGRRRRGK